MDSENKKDAIPQKRAHPIRRLLGVGAISAASLGVVGGAAYELNDSLQPNSAQQNSGQNVDKRPVNGPQLPKNNTQEQAPSVVTPTTTANAPVTHAPTTVGNSSTAENSASTTPSTAPKPGITGEPTTTVPNTYTPPVGITGEPTTTVPNSYVPPVGITGEPTTTVPNSPDNTTTTSAPSS